MNFRGKQWKRNGNHYNLVGTKVNVYFWNSGANQTYLVEILGRGAFAQRTYGISGKGSEARDKAIKKALELAEMIGKEG